MKTSQQLTEILEDFEAIFKTEKNKKAVLQEKVGYLKTRIEMLRQFAEDQEGLTT